MAIIYTIGANLISAEVFFTALKQAEVTKVIDIRLSNVSHLAGFSRNIHIPYFLKVILNVEYSHRLELAPTDDYFIKSAKGKKPIKWELYEPRFNALLGERQVERLFTPDDLDNSCLLCSETTADQCHRRLVAEYFQEKWGDVEILHL